MQRLWVVIICLVFAACSSDEDQQITLGENLIFVAVEADGTLAVLDGTTGGLVGTIDLSEFIHGSVVRYDVHNVQVDPDGETAWLTAMPGSEGGGHGEEPMPEQLIGVDVRTFAVTARIELGSDLHVAHVVIAGHTAYVTAYESDAVLVVNLEAGQVTRSIPLPSGTNPHGARVTADGSTLIVAGMGDGSLHVVHVQSDSIESYDLPGRAVQTALAPDGHAAFATVYDTRQIARLEFSTGQLTLFDLPVGSAGPVQLYPALDGQSLWVADQGMLEDQPAGNELIQVHAETGAVLRRVVVSPGPHGVVVNQDGTRVWITTLVEGTVQSIDSNTGTVLSTVNVGSRPNGISCRHLGAAMP